jgi:hypothetical protein
MNPHSGLGYYRHFSDLSCVDSYISIYNDNNDNNSGLTLELFYNIDHHDASTFI